MIFSKIHSFSKPVPLPPVRKWQTDLPETRKCAVSQTKTFTNSLFGLWYHWIGSGSKQHKKRREKSVANEPSNATEGPRWLPRAERFVRHALLAEPAFLDLHWRKEMVNSTFPRPIGIDSSLCLLSQHTWRRILPRPIGIDSPLCLLSQHTWRRILPRRCHLDRRRGGCCPATATGANKRAPELSRPKCRGVKSSQVPTLHTNTK